MSLSTGTVVFEDATLKAVELVAETMTLNNFSVSSTTSLQQATNTGNVTTNTVEFTNPTTAFVTTGNVEVGTANLFVDTVSGNVGIGRTDPRVPLDINSTEAMIVPVGTTAQRPSSGVAGMIRLNTSSNELEFYLSNSWLGLKVIQPTNFSGLVGWYLAENWTGSQWTDISSAANHATAYEGTITLISSYDGTSDGANYVFPVIYGGTTAEINFPTAILPSTYTLVSLTRYNGTNKKRILDAQDTNWLSGHWSGSAGVAYHGGWVTTQTNRHGTKWVIGVDQNNLYRSKSQNVTWEENTMTSGTNGNLRLGSVNYEASDWMCAEIIVYNRTLTSVEYTELENYMQNKYNIY